MGNKASPVPSSCVRCVALCYSGAHAKVRAATEQEIQGDQGIIAEQCAGTAHRISGIWYMTSQTRQALNQDGGLMKSGGLWTLPHSTHGDRQ